MTNGRGSEEVVGVLALCSLREAILLTGLHGESIKHGRMVVEHDAIVKPQRVTSGVELTSQEVPVEPAAADGHGGTADLDAFNVASVAGDADEELAGAADLDALDDA